MADIDPTQTEAKGAEAAYQSFLSRAREVDPRDIVRFKADARLAQHNLSRAVSALTPHQEALAKKLSEESNKVLSQQLSQANLLSQALLFSDLEVERHRRASPGETNKKLAEARELRGLLLDGARVCVRAKLLDAQEVRKIERGRGPFDVAEDCIALARLYRDNASKIKGATPVTTEQIERAAELGTELSTIFKPSNTTEKTKNPEALEQEIDLRDRLWTLLTQHHEALWSAGALLFGLSVTEHIPMLQSRIIEQKPAA